MLNIFRRGALAAALVIGATLPLLAPSPAMAACTRTQNCFVGGYPTNASGSTATMADGIYARIQTEYGVDVGLSNGTAGVQTGNATVEGHNTRTIQVNAYGDNPEFAGIGYTAGCGLGPTAGGTGCTGTLNGGVLKKFFLDGDACDNFGCRYFVEFFGAIDGGAANTYQIQRYTLAEGPKWRYFHNGVERTPRVQAFLYGYTTIASERSGSADTLGRDIPLNMTESFFDNVYFHKYGDASTRPPGTFAYTVPSSFSAFNDFNPPCGLAPISQGIKVTGRC